MKRRFCWAALLLALLLNGCWSSREINELAIVLSAGVDLTENGQVTVTVLMSNPSNPSTQSGQGGGQSAESGGRVGGSWIVSTTGPSFFEAVRAMAVAVPRRLFWPHAETLVVSERMARNGLGPILDVLTRDPEPRRTMYLLVSKDPLADVVGSRPILEQSLSRALDGLIQNRNRHSHAAGGDLNQYVRLLNTGRTAPMTLAISRNPDPTGGLGLSPPLRLELEQSAVFWENKLVGYFNEKESMGALLVQGKLRGGLISMPCPGEPGNLITMVVDQNRSSLNTTLKNGRLQGTVAIKVEGRIGQVQCRRLSLTPTNADTLGRLWADEVRNLAQGAIKKAQSEFGVDPFGFGDSLFRQNPAAWQRIGSRWPEPFRTISVTITAQTRIRNSGLSVMPDPIRR